MYVRPAETDCLEKLYQEICCKYCGLSWLFKVKWLTKSCGDSSVYCEFVSVVTEVDFSSGLKSVYSGLCSCLGVALL